VKLNECCFGVGFKACEEPNQWLIVDQTQNCQGVAIALAVCD
jgi:hypothetical protein